MEKRFHSGHCGEKISKTLYYQHKRLYYSAANSWRNDSESGCTLNHSSEKEFIFSDDEADCEDPDCEDPAAFAALCEIGK